MQKKCKNVKLNVYSCKKLINSLSISSYTYLYIYLFLYLFPYLFMYLYIYLSIFILISLFIHCYISAFISAFIFAYISRTYVNEGVCLAHSGFSNQTQSDQAHTCHSDLLWGDIIIRPFSEVYCSNYLLHLWLKKTFKVKNIIQSRLQ